MRKPLWDDEAFKRWVQAGAEQQGMTLREVLHEAGVSRFYLKDTHESRGTNIVLNLAEILQSSPASLFSIPDTPDFQAAFKNWRRIVSQVPKSSEGNGRTDRMRLTARFLAQQMATWVYISADRADLDPAVLFELVTREINNNHKRNKETAEPPSSNEAA